MKNPENDELAESDDHRAERLASEDRAGRDLEHVRERRRVRTNARRLKNTLSRTATARCLTAKGRT